MDPFSTLRIEVDDQNDGVNVDDAPFKREAPVKRLDVQISSRISSKSTAWFCCQCGEGPHDNFQVRRSVRCNHTLRAVCSMLIS